MTTRDQAERAAQRDRRASDNSAFVRKLLSERQPGFFAALLSAERLVDLELGGARAVGRVLPDGLRSVLGMPEVRSGNELHRPPGRPKFQDDQLVRVPPGSRSGNVQRALRPRPVTAQAEPVHPGDAERAGPASAPFQRCFSACRHNPG